MIFKALLHEQQEETQQSKIGEKTVRIKWATLKIYTVCKNEAVNFFIFYFKIDTEISNYIQHHSCMHTFCKDIIGFLFFR
jgi:hypothetical protein